MEYKNIVATIYLKDGQAVRSHSDVTPVGDIFELCELYNDSGIDKLIIFDLSDEDAEHEQNIHIIRDINRRVDIKVCAGGNIRRMDDVQKLLYAGCLQVILNGSKPNVMELALETSRRFGKDRVLIAVKNVDFIFKNHSKMEDTFHELLLLNSDILDSVENITSVPHVVTCSELNYEKLVDILKRPTVRGITGPFIIDPSTDVMSLKSRFSDDGIKMDNFAPKLKWSDLKLNSDGMVPVIVQDYRTDEVLMLAYMDEEAFNTTIRIGKMTYHSRSRNELWTKGLTSGNLQYVKSLTADCDFDTILAKVAPVGPACHTGKRSCFFHEIVSKEYVEKNPRKILERVYDIITSRKEQPINASFTSHLFSQGLDPILKYFGEEATEVLIASKNPEDPSAVRAEISDLMYSIMILMVEKGITWEEITSELAQR